MWKRLPQQTWFKGSNIQIYDTYKVHDDSDVTMKFFGKWNPNSRLAVSTKPIWMRRKSLDKQILR